MRAALFYDKGDIRVEEIQSPQVKDGQVLVDVEWCGICGSDLHAYVLGQGSFSTRDNPHPLTDEYLPLAMGHEFCGRVRSPPAGSKLKEGQAVMVDPRILCRSCGSCQSGHTHGCMALGYMGYHRSGGFAEQVAIEERMVHPLPENVPLEDAAVIEPLAVAHHAVEECGISDWASQDILVLGGGPIGLAVIVALKAAGALNIVVSEPAQVRRKQVSDFVNAVLDPVNENVGQRCRELTSGQGASVVFDCAGVPKALEAGFDAIRFIGGLYMNVALWEEPMSIPLQLALLKHVTIKYAFIFSDRDFVEVMRMMGEGKFVGYEKLITDRIRLEDISQKGFEELINNKDSHVKILVSPKK